LLLLSLCTFAAPLRAQVELPWHEDVWQDDFSNFSATRYFTGSATRHDAASGRMIMTPPEAARSGRLLLRRPLHIESFDASIRATFGVSSGANGGGGDGMVFLFGPVDTWPETGGGTLGFNGCLGYGVEFDTYQNPELGDPNHEHIAVIKDVSSNHLRIETLALPTIEDGRVHTLHIRLRQRTISVWIDGIQRLSHTEAGLDPFDGFLGVSAACGAAFNEQAIDEIRVAMPSRARTSFGPYRLCGPLLIDTSLVITNAHEFGSDLTITAISLSSATPGIITLPVNPAPSVLPWQGRVSIPLRIQLPGEGVWEAVLRLDSDKGETVYDTLRVSAYIPHLAWSIPSLLLPPQPVGSLRDTIIFLKNTGMVEAEVTNLAAASPAISVSAPSSFPLLIQPGDSIAVLISVRPEGAGEVLDSIVISAPCGSAPALAVSLKGVLERIVTSFTKPALMLNPGGEGVLTMYLDTLPEFTPLYTLEGEFTFAVPELRFDGNVTRGSALPPSASFTAMETSAGRITWRVSSPAPLIGTGPLVGFQMTAMSSEQECLDVEFLSGEANAAVPGQVPLPLSGNDGRICINASCRHPEGLRYTAPPAVRVYPNPLRNSTTVRIDAATSASVEISVHDLLGRTMRVLFSGWMEKGTLSLPLPADGLPSGLLFLNVLWDGSPHTMVIVVGE